MIKVLKASGDLQPFDEQKVRRSLARAGADPKLQNEILAALRPQLYDGIPTKKIYRLVFDLLAAHKTHLASRYQLKKAIADLGPSGYPFEQFFAGILKTQGYRVQTNQLLEGRCTRHEVDILAEKDGQKVLIECKHHADPHFKLTVKIALYVYGRFQDLKDKHQLTGCWLVTNTKFTAQTASYCRCAGLQAVSWNHPPGQSLSQLIEQSGLHPITTLTTLTRAEKERLLTQNIVFCRDLYRHPRLADLVPRSKLSPLKTELRLLLPS